MPEIREYRKKIARIIGWVEHHPQYDNFGLTELLAECGDIELDTLSFTDRAPAVVCHKIRWNKPIYPTWRETIAALRAILAASEATPPA